MFVIQSRNRKCPSLSLLRNFVIHFFANVLSKVWRTKNQFCWAHQATARWWLIVYNGSANQISTFAVHTDSGYYSLVRNMLKNWKSRNLSQPKATVCPSGRVFFVRSATNGFKATVKEVANYKNIPKRILFVGKKKLQTVKLRVQNAVPARLLK